MSKWFIRSIIISIVLLLVCGGLFFWRTHTLSRIQTQTENELTAAWAANDYPRVRLLAQHLPEESERSDWLTRLDDAQLEQALANNDAYTVRSLRGVQADNLISEEEALLLARAAVHERDTETYDDIRAIWQRDLAQSAAWIFLEVDALIVSGKITEARNLLSEHVFSGQAESNRILRLSLLSVIDPRETLSLIDQAVATAPANPDALSFRGQILESLGSWKAARADYVRAVALAPDSPLFWDQLSEFYRRRQQYALAVESWIDGYEQTSIPEFWIKSWFWKRVTGLGPQIPSPPTSGPFVEYANYLSEIPENVWWIRDKFETLPYASRILQQRQEAYWLRFLQTLQEGNDAEALALLRGDPFAKRDWAPRLKSVLATILLWRSGEPLPPVTLDLREGDHQFLEQVAVLSPSDSLPETESILTGSSAWASAFLAEGWLAAAIDFDEIENGQPSWYGYGQAQARRQLESVAAALERLEVAKMDQASEMLRADLQWLKGDQSAAIEVWNSTCDQPDAIGQRAAMLLAMHYATSNQWDQVEELFTKNPKWAASMPGVEMRARVALSRGNLAGAQEAYSAIVDSSMDAKLFLARLAYQNGDWSRARELTQKLIKENPDEPTFYSNLEAIDKAEAKP